MKKILFIACALLIGGFTAQAQEDSDMVGTATKKVVVKTTSTAPTTSKSQDELNPNGSSTRNEDMKKVLAERKAKSDRIKAAKKKAAMEEGAKTMPTTSKARVITKAQLEAEEQEKRKKAGKIDN